MGTDRGSDQDAGSYLIEMEPEELRLLIHSAAIGAPNVGTAEDVANLRKLLVRLQELRDGTA